MAKNESTQFKDCVFTDKATETMILFGATIALPKSDNQKLINGDEEPLPSFLNLLRDERLFKNI